MNKYIQISKYELKSIMKNSIGRLLMFYPIVMTIMVVWLFPFIINMAEGDEIAKKYTSLILLIISITMGGYVIGIMLTFNILDKKDEKSLYTIAVTPLSTKGYLYYQLTFTYILSVISSLMVLGFTKLLAQDAYTYEVLGQTINLIEGLTWGRIIAFVFVGSLWCPAWGLIISAFANNSIEGLAYVKGSGIFIMLPLLMVLETFNGGLQYILGIAPNFWAIKGLMATVMPENSVDLPFAIYMLIGLVYGIALNVFAIRLFEKKTLSTI